MKKLFLLFFLPILAISNFPPGRYYFDYILDEQHYRYTNKSGSFENIDRSGSNIKGVRNRFEHFKIESKKPEDRLYRRFWKNPLAFWRWHSYFSNDPRYDLPYLFEIDREHDTTK